MDGATVPVADVTSRIEAELIAGMLRSHGLSAAVSADDAGGEGAAAAVARCPRTGCALR
jgi:hypothetical protein